MDIQAKKDAMQKKHDEQNAWHKLVVKIISWSDGLSHGGSISPDNKISNREWNIYTRHRISMCKSGDEDTDKVRKKLRETKKLIKSYNGFV